MEQLFDDILNLPGVQGVFFFSEDGTLEYHKMGVTPKSNLSIINWKPFIQSLGQIKEADLVYENCRIYIRQTYGGYLLIHMNQLAQASMIRLNCDLLMPHLKAYSEKKTKGGASIGRMFKAK